MPVFHITFFAYPAIFEAQHNKKTWVTFIVPFYSHIMGKWNIKFNFVLFDQFLSRNNSNRQNCSSNIFLPQFDFCFLLIMILQM